jgi:nitrate reductase NapAB chaperone NapD
MTISGVVMACRPEDLTATTEAVDGLAWADVHYTDPKGRVVVTIEAEDMDESIERFKQLQGLPRVLSAALAQYCAENQ